MNSITELEGLVCRLLTEACRKTHADLTPRTNLLELDIDSLTFASIVAQVEAVYEIEVSPESLLWMMEQGTIGDLVRCLSELRPASSAIVCS